MITAEPSQTKRIVSLQTPLGPEKLAVVRFEAEEGLSELFEYRIDAISNEQNIDFDRAIGKNCSVVFDSYGGVKRVFNGVLTEAQWSGVEQSHDSYRLVLRPWLWLLGRKTDCRIFRDKNAIDVIEEVFDTGGFSDFQVKASRGDYKKMEFCVQYRETDLAFVSRLMEEFGIYTYHEHGEGRHTLILADSRSCHSPVSIPGGRLPFVTLSGQDRRIEEHVTHWLAERRFRTGKIAFNDFDYMKPSANLKTDAQAAEGYAKSKLEAYDYPGRYLEQDDGQKLAKVRLQAEQALDRRKHASGDAVSLFPGGLVTLKQHPTDDGEYLVVRASHVFVSEGYRSGFGDASGEVYRGQYDLLSADRPFRAPQATPRPLVHGPQTGIVVARKGKEGEEIDVDEEGRIFVQFHWNRDKDRISLPVRVAQTWSGKGWGSQFIPRVGQEVVIEFLEGDPDKPLVVGTVYNKDYRYPYEMPAKKTQSGVKSDSSKGHNGYNEFMFEDKKGEETIRMRAEKDHDTIVRHAETRVVGETFETPVGSPSHSTKVKMGDMKLEVETGDWNATVCQKVKFTANVMMTFQVGASKIELTPAGIIVSAPLIKLN